MDDIDEIIAPVETVRVSIKSHFTRTVRAFQNLRKALENPEPDISNQIPLDRLEEELAFFRLWAGANGAHRSGRASLDHKLRLSGDIHDKLTVDLAELEDSLYQGVSIAFRMMELRSMLILALMSAHQMVVGRLSPRSPSPAASTSSSSASSCSTDSSSSDDLPDTPSLQYAFEDIQHRIKGLMRLSVVLTQPASRDLTAKYSEIPVQHYAEWDHRYVQDKVHAWCCVIRENPLDKNLDEAPNMACFCPKELISRLAKANTERRQLIRYFQRHHQKIAKGVDADIMIEQTFNNEGPVKSLKAESRIDHETMGGYSRQTDTTNWTFMQKNMVPNALLTSTADIPLDVMNEDGGTVTSFVITERYEGNVDSGAKRLLEIPRPPKESQISSERGFSCPICWQLIAPQNTKDWK